MKDRMNVCKSILCVSAACVMLLPSCQRDELPREEISFAVEDNWGGEEAAGVTKTTVSGFSGGDRIGVYSYYYADYVSSPDVSKTFMDNQWVEFYGTYWDYSPALYWPENEKSALAFYAYSPYAENIQTSDGRLLLPCFKIGKKDVAWAREIDGVAPGTNRVCKRDNPYIGLTFTHKLTQLKFRFNQGDRCPEGYNVTHIKLKGMFPHSAYLDIKTGTWEYSYDNNYFSFPDQRKSEITVTDSVPIDQDADTEAVIYLLGLEGMTGLDVEITTDYHRTFAFTIPFGDSAPAPDPDGGRSYGLNFSFQSIDVISGVNLTVADWKDVPLDAELGEKITPVNVNGDWTVEDWISVTSQNVEVGGWSEATGSGGWTYDDWLKEDLEATIGDQQINNR